MTILTPKGGRGATTSSTAVHEAAHALAAYVFGIAVRSVSIKPRETHLGITNFNASGFEPDLDCAVVFAAGPMASRMFEGRTERINWLADDHDVSKALWFLERTPNPLLGRQIAELRARSLLFTRWSEVLSLGNVLEQRGVLLGSQVEEHLRGKVRLARDKPVDPSAPQATVGGTTVREQAGQRGLVVCRFS